MSTEDEARGEAGYEPPRVWTWHPATAGSLAKMNRPISGATYVEELPVGRHPIQLYSMGTKNGAKVTIMLEELLAAGHSGAEYDAWLINIGEHEQFSSGFVAINPNSKVPAMVDRSLDPPISVFESGSILFYLAEKFDAFLPRDLRRRTDTMNWLMWQMGAAPYLGGGFGHFYAVAQTKLEYAIDRFALETKRQLHMLDTHLERNEYMIGAEYTIADIAAWPWYAGILQDSYGAQEFLAVHEYRHLGRWVDLVGAREPVRRGRMVNRLSGPPGSGIRERHAATDFDEPQQGSATRGQEKAP